MFDRGKLRAAAFACVFATASFAGISGAIGPAQAADTGASGETPTSGAAPASAGAPASTAAPAYSSAPAAPAALPLSLARAIEMALAQNLSYRSAAARVDGARGQVRQAAAPFLPGVQLRDTYQYVDPVAALSTPFGSIPFSTTRATNVPLVAMQYQLYDGGLSAARYAQAEAGLAASEASMREARSATIAATTKAYFDVEAALQFDGVARGAVDVAKAHAAQADRLFAAGQIPKADVLRAQTEVANQEVNAISAASAVALSQSVLASVMNVPLDTVYAPTEPLDTDVPSLPLAWLLESARNTRGELLAARASAAAAEHAVSEARSGNLPQIGLVVANGNTQPAVVSGYHNQFSVGINAALTLFDHGYTSGRVKSARAGVDLAKLGVQQLENGIALQVRQAYLRVNEANARVGAATRYVSFAEENLRLAQLRYSGSVGTALELQDAELSATSARQTLVGAKVALRQGIVALRFAAGLL
jgi:outer membrane protein TolC